MIGRRSFIKGLGAGVTSLALPFARAASGQTSAPRRFIGVFTANGVIANRWVPSGSERNFTLGPSLRALEPFKSKLLVLEGLDMTVTGGGPGSGHQRGAGAVMTGARLLPGDFCGGNNCSDLSGWADGISVDQRIAAEIGGDTRFRSLELGVRIAGSNNRHRMAYRGSNDPLPPDDNPFTVFDRLFADTLQDRALRARRQRERQSVLDFARADLTSLRRRLGTEHRARLDAHLQSLRTVERQLQATPMDTDPRQACDPVALGSRFNHRGLENYPMAGRLQMDLLARAIACDLTRVATLMWSGATSNQTFPWLEINEGHHSLSHESDSNADAQRKLAAIDTWYAEQFAYLLGALDAIKEDNGATALDNSIVFWGNELSKGNSHSRNNMHFIVAGGGGGALRTGRFLRYSDVSHNNLLLTFLRAFGIQDRTFGDPRFSNGPLSDLLV